MPELLKLLPEPIIFKRDGCPTVSISSSALGKIKKLAKQFETAETGGILVGRNLGNDIQVIEASDAGPNAKRSSGHFLRDTTYCREFLAQCYEQAGADYVGEWHTHVDGPRHLSQGDLLTLVGILTDPDYDFPAFALFLVVLSKRWLGAKRAELFVYVARPAENKANNRIDVVQLYRGKFPKCERNSQTPE